MKLNYILLLLVTLHYSALHATDFTGLAKPAMKLNAPSPGHGTRAGIDVAFYRHNFEYHSNGKTINTSPSTQLDLIPNVQFQLTKRYSASIGFGINSYNDKSDNAPLHNTESEMYYGPSLSLYRYCNDPCDDDDWESFIGFNAYYYTGPRTYYWWDDNAIDKTHHVENGMINELGAGLFAGANYNLGHHFGFTGRVFIVDYNQYKTTPDKANKELYYTSSNFNFLNWVTAGVYFKLGK